MGRIPHQATGASQLIYELTGGSLASHVFAQIKKIFGKSFILACGANRVTLRYCEPARIVGQIEPKELKSRVTQFNLFIIST